MTNLDRKELLKPLLFIGKPNEHEFFVVRILQRRKDNPEMDLPERQLKVYSFYSWEELQKNYHRIVEICELNNARAYIRLNTQDAVEVSHRVVQQIMSNLIEGNPRKNERVWDSITGQKGKKDYWVIDIDTEHLYIVDSLVEDLKNHYFERSRGGADGIWTREWSNEVHPIVSNPTKSGVHLIVKPFDTRILSKYNEDFQRRNIPIVLIQKDSNTVLYLPEGR